MKTMHERLSGKIALITDTSGGQGRAAAKPFTAAESNDECENIGESRPMLITIRSRFTSR
jgi:hypothetical protein